MFNFLKRRKAELKVNKDITSMAAWESRGKAPEATPEPVRTPDAVEAEPVNYVRGQDGEPIANEKLRRERGKEHEGNAGAVVC